MQKEIEIINDGLSYKEKLECIAKRFGMTQEQALKNIIHDIYISEVTLSEFKDAIVLIWDNNHDCLLYTSPSPRDAHESRMPSSA